MQFCRMCGTPLRAPRAASDPPSGPSTAPTKLAAETSGSAKQTCSACHKQTPAGFAFCQHCGSRFPSQPAAEAARDKSVTTTLVDGPRERPTLLAVTTATARAAGGVPLAETPREPSAKRGPIRSEPRPVVRGHPVVVGADGKDGASHPVVGDSFDIGRLEGGLVVGGDPYLAGRHARITFVADKLRVRSLDTVNGVYLRLREAHDLAPGDQLFVGHEVLRFEALAPEERDPPHVVEHGVRLLGSATRESWGRLRQLTGAGTTRDVWHLSRPEIVLGRSSGDVQFPDDELVSELHAILRRPGAGEKTARVEDAGSATGTYLRLRGEQTLRPGDLLRLGELLLRYEA
jgi:pSer/pThr/pTyr-binding forkhead associated (FHA) protein